MKTITEAILSKTKLSNEDLIIWSNYVKPYKKEDYDLSIKGNKFYISTSNFTYGISPVYGGIVKGF